MTKKEFVDHPAHYLKDTGYEVIDIIEAWDLDFCLGNAIKYIARSGRKDKDSEIQDLNKSIWYIKRRIESISTK
jgi:hypothetical protein